MLVVSCPCRDCSGLPDRTARLLDLDRCKKQYIGDIHTVAGRHSYPEIRTTPRRIVMAAGSVWFFKDNLVKVCE